MKSIINNVRVEFNKLNNIETFDEFYVFKALDKLLPFKNINNKDEDNIKLDFNEYIYNAYNKKGHLIVRNNYYYF